MGTINLTSPFYPGQNRIVIDDLRGDALMQRITDLIDGDATEYVITRSINNTANVGVLISYSRFVSMNALATGDKAPAYTLEDKTDDFVIPNLNMVFDVVNGNAQQSPAGQYRGRVEGSKTVVSSIGATVGVTKDVGYAIKDLDSLRFVTGGGVTPAGATGGQITVVDQEKGQVRINPGTGFATGAAATIFFNYAQYKAIAIRRAASPYSATGGVGNTGASVNREAILLSAAHFNGLTGVQP